VTDLGGFQQGARVNFAIARPVAANVPGAQKNRMSAQDEGQLLGVLPLAGVREATTFGAQAPSQFGNGNHDEVVKGDIPRLCRQGLCS
jgi:hypothetical protein